MVLLRYRTLIFCHPRFRSEIKVDGQLNVTTELILGHSHVANSKVQAQHFLHLVLDGASNFIDVVQGIVSGRDTSGELAFSVETRQKTRNTLDQSIGSHEGVVFVRDFLEFGFFLLQRLELVLCEERESVITGLLHHFDVLGVGNHTYLHAGLRWKREPVGATKTLVLAWIKIFNGDL